jgi:hypothetical protein
MYQTDRLAMKWREIQKKISGRIPAFKRVKDRHNFLLPISEAAKKGITEHKPIMISICVPDGPKSAKISLLSEAYESSAV